MGDLVSALLEKSEIKKCLIREKKKERYDGLKDVETHKKIFESPFCLPFKNEHLYATDNLRKKSRREKCLSANRRRAESMIAIVEYQPASADRKYAGAEEYSNELKTFHVQHRV